MNAPIAWKNGTVIPFEDMSVPVWDMGVVAGASITEMARTYRHCPFRLGEHVDRLLTSCRDLRFECPWSHEELLSTANDIVSANAALLAESDDIGIVLFVTAGSNPTYLGGGDLPGPTVGIHTFRLPFEIWKKAASEGVRLSIPPARQISADSLPVQYKTRNRLHWWLADRQADAIEAGSRALLLDENGRLTETSTSSFYAVIGGEIVTPEKNVLNSMSRRMVKELAEMLGVPFQQRDLKVEDLESASEAFLSSTPTGLFGVSSINGNKIEDNSEPVLVPRLLAEWEKLTGINPREQILGTLDA